MPDTQILAFDFGLAYIGIATGQTVTGTASALTTIRATDGRPDWAALDVVIREWLPGVLVVGLPLNMDGSESDMSAHARRFGDQLRGRYGCRVEFADERLTTFEARQRTPDGRDAAHAIAAELIAQTWLTGEIKSGEINDGS